MTQVDRLDSKNGHHTIELCKVFIKIQVQVRGAFVKKCSTSLGFALCRKVVTDNTSE
jgi:hypothetical protein